MCFLFLSDTIFSYKYKYKYEESLICKRFVLTIYILYFITVKINRIYKLHQCKLGIGIIFKFSFMFKIKNPTF